MTKNVFVYLFLAIGNLTSTPVSIFHCFIFRHETVGWSWSQSLYDAAKWESTSQQEERVTEKQPVTAFQVHWEEESKKG